VDLWFETLTGRSFEFGAQAVARKPPFATLGRFSFSAFLDESATALPLLHPHYFLSLLNIQMPKGDILLPTDVTLFYLSFSTLVSGGLNLIFALFSPPHNNGR
jgi:hypothetical protein